MSRPAGLRLGRRQLLVGSALAVGAFAAACSTEPDATSDGASGGPASPSTRTVQTAHGAVEVPARATKVAAVSYDAPLQLRSIGITPIAVFDYSTLYDQFTEDEVAFFKSIPTSLGRWGEPDLEKLAAAAPDLIVGVADEVSEDVYAKLSAVAPTAVFQPEFRGDWEFVLTGLAEAAGATDALGTAKQQYEDRIAEVKQTYADTLTGHRWVSYSFGNTEDEFSVQFPTGSTGALMQDLGMTFSDVVGTAEPDAGYESYALERLDLLADADRAIHPIATDGSEYPAIAALHKTRLFKAQPIAKNGADSGLEIFYSVASYTSAMAAIDELEEKVLKPLAG